MRADDHPQLYLSSPDSTYSRSSLSSSSSNRFTANPSRANKSFLISDILKPNFGHQNTKCHIPLSPTPTNESSSSKQGILPAWVFCTRYSDRPSAGKIFRDRNTRESKTISFQVLEQENPNHPIPSIRNGHVLHLLVIS